MPDLRCARPRPKKRHFTISEQLKSYCSGRHMLMSIKIRGQKTDIVCSHKRSNKGSTEAFDIANSIVLFEEDPFHPIIGKLDLSLKAIEFFASQRPKLLCIETSSPLVLLCVPILLAISSRAVVSLRLEQTPERSRQDAECRRAAEALKSAGINAVAVNSFQDNYQAAHEIISKYLVPDKSLAAA